MSDTLGRIIFYDDINKTIHSFIFYALHYLFILLNRLARYYPLTYEGFHRFYPILQGPNTKVYPSSD
nr:MAG TPA: hypothetical protein [Crassvirales sp.]